MLKAEDIDELVESIVHGAEERYVAELSAALIDNLVAGVFGAKAEVLLDVLARACRSELDTILLAHKQDIEQEVIENVQQALARADDGTVEALEGVYGPAATHGAAAAARAAGMGTHFAELSLQTARGLAEIVARQNIALAAAAERTWYEVTGEAITAINHGLKPRDKVITEAVDRLATAGLETIDYKSGIKNQIDVAVRRHLVSQVSQAGSEMTLARLEQYGHELVITSAHYGARPSHAEWQGRPCCTKGSKVVGGISYPSLVELTGYGTVGGLKGVNCRHSISPYFPGITKLPDLDFPAESERFGMTSEQWYDATQRQRELERRVRKTKREVSAMEQAGLGLESPSYVQKRLVLGRQQAALRSHCNEKQLVRQYAREKAYGVGSQPRALQGRTYWSGGARRTYMLSDLTSFEAKYRGTAGREVGMVFGLAGEDVKLLDGGSCHHIRFSLPSGRKWSEVSVAHTHPDKHGGTFSTADMFFVTDSGVRALHAVCCEGTYTIAPGPKPKARSLMRAYDRAYQSAVEGSAGLPDKTGRVREAMHAWLSKNAGEYGFDYSFKEV